MTSDVFTISVAIVLEALALIVAGVLVDVIFGRE